MDEMREWFYSLMLVSVFSGALSLLSPEKTGKTVRYLCSLCLVGVLLSPLSSLLTAEVKINFSVSNDSFESGESLLIEETGERIKEEVAAQISKKYGISADVFSVELTLGKSDLSNITVDGVTVISSDRGILHHRYEIEEYVSEAMLCGCELKERQ